MTARRAASGKCQAPVDCRFAALVRIFHLFVPPRTPAQKFLHCMYASRQNKRFAGQTIIATIDGSLKISRGRKLLQRWIALEAWRV